MKGKVKGSDWESYENSTFLTCWAHVVRSSVVRKKTIPFLCIYYNYIDFQLSILLDFEQPFRSGGGDQLTNFAYG